MKTRTIIVLSAALFLAQGCGDRRQMQKLTGLADSLKTEIRRVECSVNELVFDRYVETAAAAGSFVGPEAFEEAGIATTAYFASDDSLSVWRRAYRKAEEKVGSVLENDAEYRALREKYVPVLGTPAMRKEYDEATARVHARLSRGDASFREASSQLDELRARIGRRLLDVARDDYRSRGECLPVTLIPDSVYRAIAGADDIRTAETQRAALETALSETMEALGASAPEASAQR